jgi:hypothetical protein
MNEFAVALIFVVWSCLLAAESFRNHVLLLSAQRLLCKRCEQVILTPLNAAVNKYFKKFNSSL